MKYDANTAIQYIESVFPHLTADLYDDIVDGLLHCQIAVLASYAQSVIDGGDEKLWRKVSQTFMELWRQCDPDVTNALNVSFLENINFTDGRKKRSWAYVAMPAQMRSAWDAMEAYNRKLHGG
jgi:hypothetical protein